MSKKGQVQLQAEISTNDEWEQFLERDHLLVVDVYSDWCGPCVPMGNALKKLKLEIGGDNLQLAMAKCDDINDLERFRYRSEPNWLFLYKGRVINITFGCNAPVIINMVTVELKKLDLYTAGEPPAMNYAPGEITDYEKRRNAIEDAEKLAAQAADKAEKNAAKRTRMMETAENIIEAVQNDLILAFPNCRNFVVPILNDYWDAYGLGMAKRENVQLTEDKIEEMLYFTDFRFPPETVEMASEALCTAVLVESVGQGDIHEKLMSMVYGYANEPPGSVDSMYQKILEHIHKEENPEPEAVPSTPKAHEDGNQIEEDLPKKEDTPKKILECDLNFWHVWVPNDPFTRAIALKVCFPKICESHVVAEPEPIPPHIIMAFDALKRSEVLEVIRENRTEVMRYGFFTSENADQADFIAKGIPKFDSIAAEVQHGEKMIVQVSKKKSDTLLAFAQCGPTYISSNAEEGEAEAKKFFFKGYDDLEEHVEIVKKKRVSDGDLAAESSKSVSHGISDISMTEGEEEQEQQLVPEDVF